MLKSTHVQISHPLPSGWTEHKAPTGHTYYYNADTQTSTYTRPLASATSAVTGGLERSFQPPQQRLPNLADPRVANAYLAQFKPQPQKHGSRDGRRSGYEGRPRPEPVDKPIKKEVIPGHDPWILVYTRYSRRFVYNPAKNASYWRIPEKLMPGILELDKARIQSKATDGEEAPRADVGAEPRPVPGGDNSERADADDKDYDSSEYEEVEVEVTDDEADGDDNDDHPSKRQRIDEDEEDAPVEFTENDIAMQLQAMGEEYGLDPGEYDDGNMEEWPEGAEGLEISEEDAAALFQDLLDDFRINPYSPWEKLLEEGKIMEDPRYTALSTTKARKDCWDQWSKTRIAELREQRSRQEKKDPRVGFMAFLQEKATPKLYWPEFKRKYRKEEAMKDPKMADKDREKAYREHINRLKMSQSTLKSDLLALLKAQPLHLLHKASLSASGSGSGDGLPTQVLVDPRYISLDPQLRDPLVEAYVQTLPPPPEDLEAAAEEEEGRRKGQEARARRERALRERDRIAEEKERAAEKALRDGKRRIRENEMELEMAMRVGKRGLQSQLAAAATNFVPSQGASAATARGDGLRQDEDRKDA